MASNLKLSNREVEGEQCAPAGKTSWVWAFTSFIELCVSPDEKNKQGQLFTDSNPFYFEISISIQVANEKTLEKKVSRVLDNPTIR